MRRSRVPWRLDRLDASDARDRRRQVTAWAALAFLSLAGAVLLTLMSGSLPSGPPTNPQGITSTIVPGCDGELSAEPPADVERWLDLDAGIDPRQGPEQQPPAAEERPQRSIRVRGVLRRAGVPVATGALAFHLAGTEVRDQPVDWSLTDAEGRFEVDLLPAQYIVLCDDEVWSTALRIIAHNPEPAIDFDLPP